MSEKSYGSSAYPFLQNVLFKWAWGESPDLYDPGDLLDYLRPALEEALSAVEDPNVAVEILLKLHDDQGSADPEAVSLFLRAAMWAGWTSDLRHACEQAVKHGGIALTELVVKTFADDSDEQPFLQELLASLQEAAQQPTVSEQAGLETLIQVLQQTVSTEGVKSIWEYYESRLEWGEFEDLDGLWKMYGNAVYAITDPKWVTHQILEACEEIAATHNDHSCWVPDRVQLSQACMDTIETLGGPVAARNAISKAFELAVHNSTEPWSVMARVFRDVGNSVGEDASAHIAHIVIRATQEAIGRLYSTARLSAQKITADPERTVDLLLQAADGERAFGVFRQVQNANEGVREHAIERLIEALSEPVSDGDPAPLDDELSDVPLLRALRLAATALGDPATAANLLVVTHMATQRPEYDIDIEHGLRALADTIAVIRDPRAEIALLHGAYVDAILDGNDSGAAVGELLRTTKCVFRRSRPPIPTSRPVIPIHADHSGGAGVHSGAGVWG